MNNVPVKWGYADMLSDCSNILFSCLTNIYGMPIMFQTSYLAVANKKTKTSPSLGCTQSRQINSILLDSNRCSVNIKQGDRGYLGEESCLR